MAYKILVDDIIETKKNHPCGSNRFKIIRTGMDFVIECEKCKKDIWIARQKLEKRIKRVFRDDSEIDKEFW